MEAEADHSSLEAWMPSRLHRHLLFMLLLLLVIYLLLLVLLLLVGSPLLAQHRLLSQFAEHG
jgi:hypothetical protein